MRLVLGILLGSYKILLDTNIIRGGEDSRQLFKESVFSDLTDFLDREECKSVSLCVPRIVILERVFQLYRKNMIAYKKIGSLIAGLHPSWNVKFEDSAPDLQDILIKDAENILRKHNLEIIDLASPEMRELLFRSLRRDPPFNEGGSGDAGLKDTLFWLSLLEDSKMERGVMNYILCSSDSDFGQSGIITEYSTMFPDSDLHVVKTISDVKTLLDSKFKLGLKLEEISEKAKNCVWNHIGEIMEEIHAKSYRRESDFQLSLPSVSGDQPIFFAFSPKSHKIENIVKDGDKYKMLVRLSVSATSILNETKPNLSIAGLVIPSTLSSEIMDFFLNISYDADNNTFKILALHPPYFLTSYL